MTTAYSRSYSDSDDVERVEHVEQVEPALEPEEPFDEFDADYARFAEPETEPETTEVLTDTATPVTLTRPENPWAGKVKPLSSTWGTSIHERAYFAPSTKEDYHGVWGTKKLSDVRSWVSRARDAIDADDDVVVAAKPGEDGGYDFLVDMAGETVGYLSGSKVPPGTAPEATYIAVHVNKKGYVDTAFPYLPEIFQLPRS